jgi:hypothetical protein
MVHDLVVVFHFWDLKNKEFQDIGKRPIFQTFEDFQVFVTRLNGKYG